MSKCLTKVFINNGWWSAICSVLKLNTFIYSKESNGYYLIEQVSGYSDGKKSTSLLINRNDGSFKLAGTFVFYSLHMIRTDSHRTGVFIVVHVLWDSWGFQATCRIICHCRDRKPFRRAHIGSFYMAHRSDKNVAMHSWTCL